jgi:hypothetical protein
VATSDGYGETTAELAAPPRYTELVFQVVGVGEDRKPQNASTFANSSAMQVQGTDYSKPVTNGGGVVYGFTSMATAYTPPALAGYAGLPIAEASLPTAADLLCRTSASTRILAERSEKDVQKAILDVMASDVFQGALPLDTFCDQVSQRNALLGPYTNAAPDWRVGWASAPEITRPGMKTKQRAYALAVGEVKGTFSAVHGAFGQAGLTACSAAAVLHAWGLSAEQCIVPFFATNGFEEKHGAAHLLANGLPCVVALSPPQPQWRAFGGALAAAPLRFCGPAVRPAAREGGRRPGLAPEPRGQDGGGHGENV